MYIEGSRQEYLEDQKISIPSFTFVRLLYLDPRSHKVHTGNFVNYQAKQQEEDRVLNLDNLTSLLQANLPMA